MAAFRRARYSAGQRHSRAEFLGEIFNRNSSAENYDALSDAEKTELLLNIETAVEPEIYADELTKDTLRNLRAVKEIQIDNGKQACERYIISRCESALNVVEVYGLFALGGGKTHKFYSSLGENIAHQAIELTVQGQTVSSNFGTAASARYNIEQLVHAGVYTHLFAAKSETFTAAEETLMGKLAEESFAAYDELKNHPRFLDYLSDVSPLKFYAETNIGSRPAKRGAGKMTFEDLRAIPFVGAWSQLKQNVPGFY